MEVLEPIGLDNSVVLDGLDIPVYELVGGISKTKFWCPCQYYKSMVQLTIHHKSISLNWKSDLDFKPGIAWSFITNVI